MIPPKMPQRKLVHSLSWKVNVAWRTICISWKEGDKGVKISIIRALLSAQKMLSERRVYILSTPVSVIMDADLYGHSIRLNLAPCLTFVIVLAKSENSLGLS